MIKVLEENQVPRATIVCDNCKSLLEYGNADLQERYVNDNFNQFTTAIKQYKITCPVCGCEVVASRVSTLTIKEPLVGTDMDGGVVGEKGEQPTEEEMVGMGELGKVWNEQAIISRLDKIIELLSWKQSPDIIPYPYRMPITYKNPLDPDPNTLGGWSTTASTEGGEG